MANFAHRFIVSASHPLLDPIPAADGIVGRSPPRLDRSLDSGLPLVSAAQRHPVTPLLEVRVEIVDAAQSIAQLTLPHRDDEYRRLRALVAVRLEG
jgi:hypothetical protein